MHSFFHHDQFTKPFPIRVTLLLHILWHDFRSPSSNFESSDTVCWSEPLTCRWEEGVFWTRGGMWNPHLSKVCWLNRKCTLCLMPFVRWTRRGEKWGSRRFKLEPCCWSRWYIFWHGCTKGFSKAQVAQERNWLVGFFCDVQLPRQN